MIIREKKDVVREKAAVKIEKVKRAVSRDRAGEAKREDYSSKL